MAVFFQFTKGCFLVPWMFYYLDKQHVITAAALTPTEYYLVGNNML